MDGNSQESIDDTKMQMHSAYEKRNEDMLAQNKRFQTELQSHALMENQKLEAHQQQQKEFVN